MNNENVIDLPTNMKMRKIIRVAAWLILVSWIAIPAAYVVKKTNDAIQSAREQ